jgi:hypothetical protein
MMDMKEIDQILVGKPPEKRQPMDYAKATSKAVAIIWGLLHGMDPEQREEVEKMLRAHAKKVEESTT